MTPYIAAGSATQCSWSKRLFSRCLVRTRNLHLGPCFRVNLLCCFRTGGKIPVCYENATFILYKNVHPVRERLTGRWEGRARWWWPASRGARRCCRLAHPRDNCLVDPLHGVPACATPLLSSMLTRLFSTSGPDTLVTVLTPKVLRRIIFFVRACFRSPFVAASLLAGRLGGACFRSAASRLAATISVDQRLSKRALAIFRNQTRHPVLEVEIEFL